MIINKNHSKIIKYKNECIGIIIYNIASKRALFIHSNKTKQKFKIDKRNLNFIF